MSSRTEVITWNTSSPLIDGIEEAIQVSRSLEMPDQLLWHQEAVKRASSLDPRYLAESADGLLNAAPYNQMIDIVLEGAQGDSEALVKAKKGRKLFMIARDAIILGTTLRDSSDFDYLCKLCRQLGEHADLYGQDKDLAQDIALTLSMLQLMPTQALDHIQSPQDTQQRTIESLHTAELLSPTSSKVSHEAYHDWRKDFRRVVNAYILLAAHSNDSGLKEFAGQGMLLNTQYGLVNSSIDKHEEK